MKENTLVSSEELSVVAIEALLDKKAVNVVRMDLREVDGAITDYFIVCSGTSDRHVQALAESVQDTVREELKDRPINVEGKQLGEWVLLDYADIVVHVFLEEKREFFDIEGLWGDAEFRTFE